jgi:hypothetical protein
VNSPGQTEDAAVTAADAALATLGIRCRVEARGNLAVVIPASDERAFEDDGIRRRAIAALRAHGFSHVALEAADDRGPAPPHSTLA